MKCNQWTVALAAIGLVSLASVAQADEKPSSVATALSSTTLSGYVDTSAQWNLGTGNSHAPNYAFGGPNKADGFNLNVVKLSLEKDADAADSWGAGYKVELLFGPDADAFSTLSSSSGAGGNADFAIEQAYVDLKVPVGTGLDVKLGVWDTIIGYEVFESGNNPNVTRSYGYGIEPTTHTGVLLGYTVNDMISLQAGIANTFGPNINTRAPQPDAESYKAYMGSVQFTASTNWGWVGGSTAYAGIINGFNSASPAAGVGANQTSYYLGLTMNTPLTALKLGASYDYAANKKQTTYPAGGVTGHGYAWAADLYATYQATEKLSFDARAEYAAFGADPGANNPSAPAIGLASKIVSLTATAEYDLWKNVQTRAEARWDHAVDGNYAFGGTNPITPTGYTGSSRDSYELIASVIYKF